MGQTLDLPQRSVCLKRCREVSVAALVLTKFRAAERQLDQNFERRTIAAGRAVPKQQLWDHRLAPLRTAAVAHCIQDGDYRDQPFA